MARLRIKDDSGDRDFFTIIPNYIINHSTAIDRALYTEMKRFAGEDGRCFATEKTMMKRLEIGKKSYNKALKYLLDHEWVSYVGITKGKTRPIKTYKINNIWKLNSEYKEKISSERTLSSNKISAESEGDKFQKHTKISAESNVEEDLVLRRTNINTANASHLQLNGLIQKFKIINPSYEQLFNNKTQRSALERLVAKYGEEKVGGFIMACAKISGERYAPTITTPCQLEQKLGDLANYFKKQKNGTAIYNG